MSERVTTVVVLAAGSSRRLGCPKQTLPFRQSTLLDATLDVARSVAVDQRIVTLGGAAVEVRAEVDLTGIDVVEVEGHAQGCAASIVQAVDSVDDAADGFVLLLGDQPGVRADDVTAVAAFAHGRDPAPDAVLSRYDDGVGHPMWLGRRMFDDLGQVHGDKAVWRLLDSGRFTVAHLERPGRSIPLDVDTWDDYEALLRADEPQRSP